MTLEKRYVRLPKSADVGGVKLAGRKAINPNLTYDEAFEDEPSFGLLRAKFGEPDIGDHVYSYKIRDAAMNIEFEAYCGNSGPAYGGDPNTCFMDYLAEDYRVKPIVLQALKEFDIWLCS